MTGREKWRKLWSFRVVEITKEVYERQHKFKQGLKLKLIGIRQNTYSLIEALLLVV